MRPVDYVWKVPGRFERAFTATFNAVFNAAAFVAAGRTK